MATLLLLFSLLSSPLIPSRQRHPVLFWMGNSHMGQEDCGIVIIVVIGQLRTDKSTKEESPGASQCQPEGKICWQERKVDTLWTNEVALYWVRSLIHSSPRGLTMLPCSIYPCLRKGSQPCNSILFHRRLQGWSRDLLHMLAYWAVALPWRKKYCTILNQWPAWTVQALQSHQQRHFLYSAVSSQFHLNMG